MSTRWCPECRAGYQSWALECMDCHVALVDEIPPEVDHSLVTYDLAEWPDDRRAVVDAILRGEEILHEWVGAELRVGASHEAEVDAILDDLDHLDEDLDVEVTDDDVGPLAEEEEPGSGARIASRIRRFLGWIADALVLSLAAYLFVFLGGSLDGASGTGIYLGATAVYYVVGVALWGQTVGKRLVRIRVVDAATDGRVGWRKAALRWLVPTLTLLPELPLPDEAASIASGVLLLAVYAPIVWDEQARGIHDRLAGTVVVEAPPLR